MTARWWWGTYPEAGLGTPTGLGEGIWSMIPYSAEASLALEIPAPTFIAAHPDLPLLYAVTEERQSTIVSVDITDPEEPRVLDKVVTGGSGACHVLLANDTLTLYVSHYATGEVSVLPVSADGRLATDTPIQVFPGEGHGPVPLRQTGPHSHFAGYAPNESVLLVTDLGTDDIRRYSVLPDGLLQPNGKAITLPAGSGPRHFTVRGDLLYVTCELDHTLATLRWDPATTTLEHVSSVPSTSVPLRSGEAIYDAHVLVVNEVVLVSVRGPDVISVFDLDSEGIPEYRGGFDSGGEHPRHFAVIGENLVVGNEKSHRGSVFDLAQVLALEPNMTAIPSTLSHVDVSVPSPACILVA